MIKIRRSGRVMEAVRGAIVMTEAIIITRKVVEGVAVTGTITWETQGVVMMAVTWAAIWVVIWEWAWEVWVWVSLL
jgi:hypothetical protein